MAPEYFVYTVLHHFWRRTTFGKILSRRIRTNFPEVWKFRYMDVGIFICSKITEFDLKRVHMARYELISRLDRALWLRIIFNPLLTPKRLIKIKKWTKRSEGRAKRGPELLVLYTQYVCSFFVLTFKDFLAETKQRSRGLS